YMAIVGVVVLLIVLLVVGLLSKGGGSSSKSTAARGTPTSSTKTATHARRHRSAPSSASSRSAIGALSLRPSAPVYVCLIGDNGRKVIPGTELQPGSSTPTYHAKHFEITLGNSSVTMYVDGTKRTVAPSSQAIGYSITKASGRTRLHAGQLPTCT